MKFVIDQLGPGHIDIVREITVRTEYPASLAARIFGFEVNNLPRRVNTRVCPPGAGHNHGSISDQC